MTRRKIRPGPTVTPDVDLDTEDVRLADGTRLTNELAEGIAAQALARHPGRPSLSEGRGKTPNVTIRVPANLRAALEMLAKEQGVRLADVIREALNEYVLGRALRGTQTKAGLKKWQSRSSGSKSVTRSSDAGATSDTPRRKVSARARRSGTT